jgi:hypothetical protein
MKYSHCFCHCEKYETSFSVSGWNKTENGNEFFPFLKRKADYVKALLHSSALQILNNNAKTNDEKCGNGKEKPRSNSSTKRQMQKRCNLVAEIQICTVSLPNSKKER